MIKLKHEAKWLNSYLDAVSHLVPLEKLKTIKLTSYRSCFPSYHGLIETSNHKKYTITIRTYDKPKVPISKLDQETALSGLAHELAHLVHWNDYTIERFDLESKIYREFAKTLKKLNYEKERNRVNEKIY